MTKTWWGVVVGVLFACTAAAQDRIVIDEVLASWQGDDTVQFIELRLLADGQRALNGRADLAIDDATGTAAGRTFFTFTRDLARSSAGARVLIATNRLAEVANLEPDFVLAPGVLRAAGGRVCYRVSDGQGGAIVVDCVAWGDYQGDSGAFGRPTIVTPDNRALQRIAQTGVIRSDWEGALEPSPENNVGLRTILPSLCGNGRIEGAQGEDCEGDDLGDATCASLGFAKGKLRCSQCHFETRGCTFCGDGDIDASEECDGADFGERTCGTLGFTGGTLGCTERCKVTTADCDPTFLVPGGGPPRSDCLVEWRVMNAAARPGVKGTAPPRVRCKDGDAGCDTDGVAGTCTLPLAVCASHEDARLPKCELRGLASWTLVQPPPDQAPAPALLEAMAALGPSLVEGGTITFGPLTAAERCTEIVDVTLPVRGKLRLKTTAVPGGGSPKDGDVLRLVCVP